MLEFFEWKLEHFPEEPATHMGERVGRPSRWLAGPGVRPVPDLPPGFRLRPGGLAKGQCAARLGALERRGDPVPRRHARSHDHDARGVGRVPSARIPRHGAVLREAAVYCLFPCPDG